jgi:hypothetical protein
MAWVKCTEHGGEPNYVNFDRVITIKKDREQTMLSFGLEPSSHLRVCEDPETLIGRSESPFSEIAT